MQAYQRDRSRSRLTSSHSPPTGRAWRSPKQHGRATTPETGLSPCAVGERLLLVLLPVAGSVILAWPSCDDDVRGYHPRRGRGGEQEICCSPSLALSSSLRFPPTAPRAMMAPPAAHLLGRTFLSAPHLLRNGRNRCAVRKPIGGVHVIRTPQEANFLFSSGNWHKTGN